MNPAGDQGARLATCLSRLRPHVDADAVALAGGVAIEAHLAQLGLRQPRSGPADVDIVARSADAVSPGVTALFLVSHYHRPHPGYRKFLIQLVDPESQVRIDILPGDGDLIRRSPRLEIRGTRWRVLSLSAILDHKLELLAGATRERPVDRKHLEDALLLGRLVGRAVPECPPDSLSQDRYSTDLGLRCSRCECSVDPAFPLAPKQRILGHLGYV
jgi:hypothetical protein